MRTTRIAVGFLVSAAAWAQTAPVGDVYQSGAATPSVEQAYQKLYQIGAQITEDPSSFYVAGEVDKSHWPQVDQAQSQFANAMAQSGNVLTQGQRNAIVPCAAHVNAAIDAMERGYLIKITQQSNAPAQQTVQTLFAQGKADLTQCPPGGGSTATAGGSGNSSPMLQGNVTQSSFADQMLANAQTILQNAGRISKAMTDAMDVTKHNDVGIGVAVTGYFGAAGEMFTLVAQQYRAAAAAGAIAAAQQAPVLEIATQATSESGTIADEAEQVLAQAGKPGGMPMGTGIQGGTDYQDGMVLRNVSATPSQGILPICAVLSCARVAELLKADLPTLRILSPGIGADGMTPQQTLTALRKVVPAAQGGVGFTNMMNAVRAGSPVIAGVNMTPWANSLKHAIVIEGLETRAGVAGLNIYDPAGWEYWQPITSFQPYFDDVFVRAF